MSSSKLPYKTAFVVNPYAGKGRGSRVWKKVESFLQEDNMEYSTYFTTEEENGMVKAREASDDGAELIVALGGDGTLLEVVNGLDLKRNILGVIAGGTANGFRRSVKVPHNPILALKGLMTWPVIEMDLGVVNGRIFLNAVGAGFDAQVSLTATNDDYWLEGYPGYVAACLQHLNFKPRVVSFKLDDGQVITRETKLIVVANGRFYGGQLCIAPHAIIDDGLLEFEFLEPVSKLKMAIMGGMAFFRAHTGLHGFHTTGAKKIIVNCEDPGMPVHLDGETKDMPKFPLEFSVKEKALKIISPINMGIGTKYNWRK